MFKNFKDAVWAVCDEKGDKTSLEVLQAEADKRCSRPWAMSSAAACSARLAWREQNGKRGNDCRTNETQHRRNMYDDTMISTAGWKLVLKFAKTGHLNDLLKLAVEMHSIDQLRNMVEDVAEVRKAA